MNLLKVVLSGSAWWWVKPTDLTIYPFKHRTGWALINPGFYPLISEGQSQYKATCFGGPKDSPGTFVVCSNVLCFESPCSLEALPEDFPFDEMPQLLRQLRFASRYANFPHSFKVLSVSEWDPEDFKELPVPTKTKSGAITRLHVDALITEQRISSFTEMEDHSLPAIYSEILLDAIEAHAASDFKKSILFAAMAAETMVKTALENEYRRIIENSDDHPSHRVVEVEVTGGQFERRDPIYRLLMGSRNSSQIRRLLHELSLYTLGKSLLIENKKLYDEIIGVFDERHKIAHAGGPEIDAKGWGGNYRSVASAIRSIEKLFDWFGEPGPYPVLDGTLFLPETSD